jgi:uncharacterized protein involved in copper resistance
MHPALRTFLMWLLMLAIPVQGFAASAMLHCGPGHQRQQQAAAAMDGHEAHAAHHGQRGHSAHHAEHAMSTAVDDIASDDSVAPTSLAAAKCSACAYCCYASAIVGTPPFVDVVTPDTAPDAALPPRVEAIVPDGLDRPPRLLLI